MADEYISLEQAVRGLMYSNPGLVIDEGGAIEAAERAVVAGVEMIRQGHEPLPILLRAAGEGDLLIYGRPGGIGAREPIPAEFFLRADGQVNDGFIDISKGETRPPRWTHLQVAREALLRLAYQHSPEAELDASAAVWAAEKQRPFLSLPSALRLIVESEAGEIVAAAMNGPGWEASGRFAGEGLERARASFTRARSVLIGALTGGRLRARASGPDAPIEPHEWDMLPIDLWAGTLGSYAGVCIAKASVTELFRVPAVAPRDIAQTHESPARAKKPRNMDARRHMFDWLFTNPKRNSGAYLLPQDKDKGAVGVSPADAARLYRTDYKRRAKEGDGNLPSLPASDRSIERTMSRALKDYESAVAKKN